MCTGILENIDKAGFIYKKIIRHKYCPGCELEKLIRLEIENGPFIHPSIQISFS
jgi:hypothetical protein